MVYNLSKLFGMAEDGSQSGTSDTNSDVEESNDKLLPQNIEQENDVSNNSKEKSVPAPPKSDAGPMKREDNNPFSFKHFLRPDYTQRGARPKVNCGNRSISLGSRDDVNGLPPDPPSRMIPDYPCALPDFVQDHLVMENSLLMNTSRYYTINSNNLPDFAPRRECFNRFSCDTSRNTCPIHKSQEQQHSMTNGCFYCHSTNVHSLNSNGRRCCHDLENPARQMLQRQTNGMRSSNVQNEIENPATQVLQRQSNGIRPAPQPEVGNSKSLPDFLTDTTGIYGSRSLSYSLVRPPERTCDKLQSDLDLARRQLVDAMAQTESLRSELDTVRKREQDYTRTLTSALQRVEENLQQSNARAVEAENSIANLKTEISGLKAEIKRLKSEKKKLSREEVAGASAGGSSNEMYSQRLAQELRTAASTAEHSLRQLLTGVDNLRMMASSLENMHRIEEEKNERFLDAEEDEAGPAL